LPLTHFLRIVRGIMLKGNDAQQVLPDLWPMRGRLSGSPPPQGSPLSPG